MDSSPRILTIDPFIQKLRQVLGLCESTVSPNAWSPRESQTGVADVVETPYPLLVGLHPDTRERSGQLHAGNQNQIRGKKASKSRFMSKIVLLGEKLYQTYITSIAEVARGVMTWVRLWNLTFLLAKRLLDFPQPNYRFTLHG